MIWKERILHTHFIVLPLNHYLEKLADANLKILNERYAKVFFVFRHQPPEQAQATFTGYINKHTQFQIKI
ncbi:hypothetical protein PANA5342_2647 [Pantoea ananatis LMG 5342]|nr:hypothetical protein PANA5342_2647 [Pantoea ananatis LMG 5342]